MKNEAAKLDFPIPTKPNPNIFLRIRNDQDPINPLEISGFYRIEFEK